MGLEVLGTGSQSLGGEKRCGVRKRLGIELGTGLGKILGTEGHQHGDRTKEGVWAQDRHR